MAITMRRNGEERRMAAEPVLLTSLERALLRLLVAGCTLEEAAPAVGLSLSEARIILEDLKGRCGVSTFTRLIVLAVLNAWV